MNLNDYANECGLDAHKWRYDEDENPRKRNIAELEGKDKYWEIKE